MEALRLGQEGCDPTAQPWDKGILWLRRPGTGLEPPPGLAGPRDEVEAPAAWEPASLASSLNGHQLVWVEEGQGLLADLLTGAGRLLAGKRIICRLPAGDMPPAWGQGLDLSRLDDLICVTPGQKEALLGRLPQAAQIKRLHILPPALDPDLHAFSPKPRGQVIALAGLGLDRAQCLLALLAFLALHRQDARFRLLVPPGGLDQGALKELEHFRQTQALEEAVVLLEDRAGQPWPPPAAHYWLEVGGPDGFGHHLLAAMAQGLVPLVLAWPGAQDLLLEEHLWQDHDQLRRLVEGPYAPPRARQFVEENYSLSARAPAWRQVLEGRAAVDWPGCRPLPPQRPPAPPGLFSLSARERAQANRDYAQLLLQADLRPQAVTALTRAINQSPTPDWQSVDQLSQVLAQCGRWEELGDHFKQVGVRAALAGQYEIMLLAFYQAHYAPYVLTRKYDWMKFDPAVEAILDLVAPRVQPIPGFAQVLARVDRGKVKVAFGLEGFDMNQSPVREIVQLGRSLDRGRCQTIFLTRLAPQPAWQPIMSELEAQGCHFLCLPEQGEMAKLQKTLFALREMAADVLFLQTPWLSPWLDLLGRCRPARRVIKYQTQLGGRETYPDCVFTLDNFLVADEVLDAVYLGPTCAPLAHRREGSLPRCRGQLRLLVAGRRVKLMDGRFWAALGLALDRLPGLTATVAGVSAQELPPGLCPPHPRLFFLGFRSDLPALLPQFDLLLDTWPRGGGSTIRESFAAGVPAISFRVDPAQHMDATSQRTGGYNQMIHPELLLDDLDPQVLAQVLGRLAGEPGYLERVNQELLRLPVLTHEQYAARFQEFILALVAGDRAAASGGRG